jgi:hypothetical protein
VRPFAPARFSTITVRPKLSVSFCAIRRAARAVPPGGWGTMTRIDFTGYDCASAGCNEPASSSANPARQDFMTARNFVHRLQLLANMCA